MKKLILALMLLALPAQAQEKPLLEAYRKAMNFLRIGKVLDAVSLLETSAQKGHLAATSMLAKVLEEGKGLKANPEKAFELHQKIIATYSHLTQEDSEAALVAQSYVKLGQIHLIGLAEKAMPPNIKLAYDMFTYAAVHYNSPDAQFNLGKMLADGVEGIKKDPKQAARWLALAAAQSHPASQALIGIMLYEGKDMPRNSAQGLMYLTLALDGASIAETWIKEKYNEAMANASDDERAQALVLVEKWVAKDK